MIRYVGRIQDIFWTSDLNNYRFNQQTPIAPRDDYHSNYLTPPILLKQAFNEDVPNFQKFLDTLNISKGSVCWLCLEPREIIPIHQDYFYKLRQENGAPVEDCLRYLIMLEDWKLGHSVQFETQDLPRWRSGDVWVFDSQERHCASNSGFDSFKSCQISTLRVKSV